MTAYAIFWVDSENFTGLITSETDKTDDEVLALFRLHYPEYQKCADLYVINVAQHVHTK